MAEIITQIESGTLVKGNLVGDEDVVLLGRIEGEVTLSETFYLEPSGVVVGDVTARQVVIGGTLVGKVIAHAAVTITESGRVIGYVRAPRIVVQDGAQIRADLTTDGESPAARPAARGANLATPKSATVRAASPRGKASVVGQALKPRSSAAPAAEPVPPPERDESTPEPLEKEQASKPAVLDGEGE